MMNTESDERAACACIAVQLVMTGFTEGPLRAEGLLEDLNEQRGHKRDNCGELEHIL